LSSLAQRSEPREFTSFTTGAQSIAKVGLFTRTATLSELGVDVASGLHNVPIMKNREVTMKKLSSDKLLQLSFAIVLASCLFADLPKALADSGDGLWLSAGQNEHNTRFQNDEREIDVHNVHRLGIKWVFTTLGDVSATPAVDNQRVYFPDWAGNLYAVDRETGAQVWRTVIADATGVEGDQARATPVVTHGKVIVGTIGPFGGGGKMLAYDKRTGALLWQTTLETHPAASITQSATVHGDRIFVGVSSQEEPWAGVFPGYQCCSFRGSILALDVRTGQILWRTYTAPEGYSGNAVWGSSPAVDTRRGQLYIGTGNNYTVPPDVLACVAAAVGNPAAQQACIASDNYFDTVLALDLRTGAVRWATRAVPYDAWTVDCLEIFGGSNNNCPEPAGPDFDFAQAPALFTVKPTGKHKRREMVGVGQKSGQYWALDPDTGKVIWVTQTGPGGITGGLQWGSAVDDTRIYTANANSDLKPWPLLDGSVTDSGIWSALDPATGELLWQTVPFYGGGASGPVTTANGVVFGCSLDPSGWMYALNARTGQELWRFPSGGSCLSGAAISKGTVFWGSGYLNGFGTPNNRLYAFEIKPSRRQTEKGPRSDHGHDAGDR
jgi:polyvinyl alcohol dehydrogenase (cytochrome)